MDAFNSHQGLSAGQIIDHAIVDREGHRAGRVEDLLFEVRQDHSPVPQVRLVLQAAVSGPLSRPVAHPVRTFLKFWYHLIGLRKAHPVHIDWHHITTIDAMVHLDVDREAEGLRQVDEGVGRWIRKFPKAWSKP